MNDTKLSAIVEIWKATVEVQKHFNDIELKIRSIGVGGLGALLGTSALAYREGLAASVGQFSVSISAFVLFVAIVFWISLYFMDRFWYHRLLMGSIYHGQAIEEKYEDVLPELSLTKSIGKESPVELFGKELHSKDKMDVFYGIGGLSIFLFAIALLMTSPMSVGEANGVPETQAVTTESNVILDRIDQNAEDDTSLDVSESPQFSEKKGDTE